MKKLKHFVKLFLGTLFSNNREHYKFRLAEEIAKTIYPNIVISEFGLLWPKNQDFRRYYVRFESNNLHALDRKFFLKNLLNLVDDLEGDLAECGAYNGAASWLICEHFNKMNKRHHIFDSFEGLSKISIYDGDHWKQGDLKINEAVCQSNLSTFDFVEIHKGWIPDTFSSVQNCTFCFVHIDVDIYEPTLYSLEFFYPRMIKGGIILCDDYGFSACPGVKKALDEFMADKKEKIIDAPTGQAFVIKK